MKMETMRDCLCGRRTHYANGICATCRRRSDERITDRIAKSVQHIDVSILTKKQRVAILLRQQGLTLDQIAKRERVTHQAIDLRIKTAIEKSQRNATTY